jgi:hypothetical protein
MSDYFLNKIYDSLLNKKPVPKKPEPIVEKKESFKPLSKVYEVLVREKVEHVAIYGSKEDVDPYNVPQHPELDSLGVVPKNVVDNIKKEIKKETKFKSEEGEETTVAQILDTILQLKTWNEGFKDYKHVLNRVIQSFTQKDVIFNEIIKYPKLVKQTNNPFRNRLLQSPQEVVKINDVIPDWFNNFFEDKQGVDVVNVLCDIVFQIGTISVGPGELALSLLCDARKGDKGDLYFDVGNIDIELKGSDGRFGGGGYAPSTTANELNRILNQEEDELFNRTSNRLKRDIIKTIDGVITDRKTKRGTENEVRYYNEIKQNVISAESFNKIINNLQNFIESGTLSKTFIERINVIINSIKRYTKHIKKEVKGSFGPAVLTFFTEYKNLTDQQLIDGIVAARNYDDPHLLQSIRDGVTNIVLKEKDSLFSETDITQNLQCLLAALHGVIYHMHEKITNILFFNGETKNMILYNYPGETIQEKIKNMYEFLKKHNVKFNLSVDKSFQSIGARFII